MRIYFSCLFNITHLIFMYNINNSGPKMELWRSPIQNNILKSITILFVSIHLVYTVKKKLVKAVLFWIQEKIASVTQRVTKKLQWNIFGFFFTSLVVTFINYVMKNPYSAIQFLMNCRFWNQPSFFQCSHTFCSH